MCKRVATYIIYKVERRGGSGQILNWGTPLHIIVQSDNLPFKTTLCDLLVINSKSHSWISPSILYNSKLLTNVHEELNRRHCENQSKQYQATELQPSWGKFVHRFNANNNCNEHDQDGTKPNYSSVIRLLLIKFMLH